MKYYHFLTKLMVAFFLLSITFSHAFADTLDDFYKKRDYYSTLADRAKKQRQQKENDAASVKAEISAVEARINQTQRALESTVGQIDFTRSEIDDLAAKIAAEEDNLVREKERFNQIVASWYMEGEEGLLTAIVGAENLSEVVTKHQHYDSIQQQIQNTMEKIEELKRQLSAEKAKRDQKMVDLQDLHRSQQEQRRTLENQETVKKRLLTDTEKMIGELKDEEKKAARMEQDALSEIARIISSRRKSWVSEKGKGQRVKAGDVIGTMGSTGNSSGAHLHFEVRTADGSLVNPRNYIGSNFIWPTESRRVTQEFGMTDYAKAGAYGGNIHTGLDIGAVSPGSWGDPIYAAGPGEIVYKDWRGAYGYAVVILHDDGMITLYAHLGST